MNTKRPINLELWTLKFPVTAIASILHRITGVLLFLFIPFLLCGLEKSLSSAHNFISMQHTLGSGWMRWVMFIGLSSMIYHLFAGLRHMVMDIGFGENYRCGAISARVVIFLSVILIVLLGVRLW